MFYLYGLIQRVIGLGVLFVFENIQRKFKGQEFVSFDVYKKDLDKKDVYGSVTQDFAFAFAGFVAVMLVAFLIGC